jgi:hypothetical protein
MSNDKSSPKSFRDMKFPTSRDGTIAIYAPLPPAPPPHTITKTEAQRRAEQYLVMRQFINDQRCPVCDAQLEGKIGYDQSTVYCCSGGEREYRANFKYGNEKANWSITTYYTTMFAFEIETQYVVDDMYKNTVYKIDLNLNKKFQQLEKKMLFSYEGARMALKKNLSEEQILEKIKLYTLFS